MNLVKKNLHFKVGGISDESRAMWIIGSTEDVDRDGDRILSNGWLLDNFVKNPVIPWAHKYDKPPVAKALSVKVQDRKLKLLIKFASFQEYPFADTIFRLYKGQYLKSFSVGFNPIRYKPVERTINGVRTSGRDYIEQELWEVSACTIPSNPNALTAAKRKGIINPKDFMRISMEGEIRAIAEGLIQERIEKAVNRRVSYHLIDRTLKRRGLV
jgi:uncharacterized protein